MRLTEADAATLDRFIQSELDSSLLQSWMWGEFQAALGRTIARIGVEQNGRLVATALLIKYDLPLGQSYAYCPRGPVVVGQHDGRPDPVALEQITEQLTAQAREWGAMFVRIDPPLPPGAQEQYQSLGFAAAANQIQPRVTALLDLKQPREQLLANMKQKTRYNIRLALKKNVHVRQSFSPHDVEAFLQLNRATTQRDGFVAHPDSYYKTQTEILGRAGLLKLFIAEHNEQPLSIIVVAFHGKTATYLHGASSDAERNRMPTFAVQWEAIKEAQRLGLFWFDLHGVAPTDDPEHLWAGITRFKLGFGAKRHSYMGALDLPIKHTWYRLYKMRLSLRRSEARNQ
ncbi:MAG: peptidoglycan bridge formation glycyltransferase FemA/FemB family protein [Candidatus Andersenbacteria bacterium]